MPDPRPVSVIAADTALAADLTPERRAAAEREARALVMHLPAGRWRQPRWPERMRQGAGLLLLEGLVLRRTEVVGRFGGELVGVGDVMRPWLQEPGARPQWRVIEPAQLALLDREFLLRVARFPEITAQLFERTVHRSRDLAVVIAIAHHPKVQERLGIMLWHLALRWGATHAEGAVLPLRLTHAVLADLVAAQRQTVTAALAEMQRQGLITPLRAGGWQLHGSAPAELLAAGSLRP